MRQDGQMPGKERSAGASRPLVLHIITNLGTGGAETALLRLVSNARRYDHAVISLISKATIGPRLEAANVPVTALGVNTPLGIMRGPHRLRAIVRSRQPAVVQGWMTHGNLAATLSTLGRSIPLIWSVRQSVIDFTYEKKGTVAALRLSARIAHKADRIVYNSSRGARDHERLGYPRSTGCRIPNGFDTNIFAPHPDRRRRFREALGINDDTLLIGLIGRLHPQKNQRGFLQAASRILAANNRPVRFLLAGEGTDAANPALRQLLPAEVAQSTLFLGERNDVPDITAALDVAVNCSFGEGFSNAVGEAMSCAVPCVVTDVGDSAWVVGDTGLVVPAGDQSALERALQAMLEMSPPRRQALGAAARQRVVDEFSLAAVVRQYEDLYTELATCSGDFDLKSAAAR